MSLICTSPVTHVDRSFRVTHVNASFHTFQRVITHMQQLQFPTATSGLASHVTHLNESRHTYSRHTHAAAPVLCSPAWYDKSCHTPQ